MSTESLDSDIGQTGGESTSAGELHPISNAGNTESGNTPVDEQGRDGLAAAADTSMGLDSALDGHTPTIPSLIDTYTSSPEKHPQSQSHQQRHQQQDQQKYFESKRTPDPVYHDIMQSYHTPAIPSLELIDEKPVKNAAAEASGGIDGRNRGIGIMLLDPAIESGVEQQPSVSSKTSNDAALIQHLENQLHHYKTQERQLLSQVDTLHRHHASDLKAKTAQLHQTIDSQKELLGKVDGENENLSAQVADMKRQLGEIERARLSLKSELEAAKERVEEHKRTNLAVTGRVNELQTVVEKLERETSQQKEQITQLRAHLDTYKQRNEELEKELRKHEEDKTSLLEMEMKIEEQKAVITQQQHLLKGYEMRLSNATSSATASHNTGTASNAGENKRRSKDDLTQLIKLEAMGDDITSQAIQAAKELDLTMGQLDEMKKRFEKLEEEHQVCLHELEALRQHASPTGPSLPTSESNVDDNDVTWKQKYIDACMRLTHVLQERRRLTSEIAYSHAAHSQQTPASFSSDDRVDATVQLVNENQELKRKHGDLIKVIARLSVMTWEQEDLIKQLKMNVIKTQRTTNQNKQHRR